MSDVYVLGVDMIKFGRFPDRTVPNIGAKKFHTNKLATNQKMEEVYKMLSDLFLQSYESNVKDSYGSNYDENRKCLLKVSTISFCKN